MDHFRTIFGIEKKDIRKTCVLLPYLPAGVLKELGVKKLSNGMVFASASTDNLTVIKTNMGAGFTGDAVMYLADSICQDLIFLGSCGAINQKLGLEIGDLVLPVSALGLESFSDILTQRARPSLTAHPHPKLLSEFTKKTAQTIPQVNCVSFASLYFEENYLSLFKELQADVVEMECAAFFHAAKKTEKRALALLFVSDILGEKHLFSPLKPADKEKLTLGLASACQAITRFLSN